MERTGRPALGIVAALACIPAVAMAHPVRAPTPDTLLREWQPEYFGLAVLAVGGALYLRGVRTLWRRAGREAGVSRGNVLCFVAGWLAVALAIASPLHAMGAALFSAHMVQHEILVTIAAPLLVLGRPLVALAWARPESWRRGGAARHDRTPAAATRAPAWLLAWRMVSGVFAATFLHGAILWVWHAPALFQASVQRDSVHALQHATFLGSACVFWAAILTRGARGGRASRSTMSGVVALFVTTLHTVALGALITLSSGLLFSSYAATTAPWGLMPLEDQQLAGLIMWVPGGVVYIGVALYRMAGLLSAERPGAPAQVRARER
jgi:putative membrane protein